MEKDFENTIYKLPNQQNVKATYTAEDWNTALSQQLLSRPSSLPSTKTGANVR